MRGEPAKWVLGLSDSKVSQMIYILGGFCRSEGERSQCLGAGNDKEDRDKLMELGSLGNRIGKT